MEYPITPNSKKIDTFVWWEGGFKEQQLDWLQSKAKEAAQAAMAGGSLNNEYRRSEINWLYNTEETRWVFETLEGIVSAVNADHFGFELTGFGEPLQLTNYCSSKQGKYGWHKDFGNVGKNRKLSLVLQLSNPEDYEGGQLQLLGDTADIINIKKQRGHISIFPSWTLHQVTPVVKGTRQSLVIWVSGASFR